MRKYFKEKLNNGLTVLIAENECSDVVSITFQVRAGSRYETEGERGYAHLLEHMLMKGTSTRPSSFDVGAIANRAGALLNAHTGRERIRITAQVVKSRTEELMELIADIGQNPLFDAAILENEKKIIQKESHVESRLVRESMGQVFAKHPLAESPLGIMEDMMSATVQKLQIYHSKHFVAGNAAIIITGGITRECALELCNKYFGTLKSGGGVNMAAKQLHENPGRKDIEVTREKESIMFCFPGEKISGRERFALRIIRQYLVLGQSSRLQQELRQKRGLAYHISAYFKLYSDAFLFCIEVISPELSKVEEVVLENIYNLEKHLSPQIFEQYKDQSNNGMLRETNEDLFLNDFLAENWIYWGELLTPVEAVEITNSLTYQDIVEIINRLFKKENLYVVRLVPPKK